jgi:hypothetical protein
VVLSIKVGVFCGLYLRSGTPNIDKRGVEQYESTFYIQNTILSVGMDSHLKYRKQQRDVNANAFFPFCCACS